MKYIYYIIGILIFVTIVLFLLTADFKVKISKPAIVINDKIISTEEYKEILKSRADTSHMKNIVNSIITNELLIQEAIRKKINKEEAFRQSIENFYEQSLVKILIDREFKSLNPEISEAMIDRYSDFCNKTIIFIKYIYKNRNDVQNKNFIKKERYEKSFENLSAELRYTLFTLTKGERSNIVETEEGYITYLLEDLVQLSDSAPVEDIKEIRDFLVHQKKSVMFDNWLKELEKNADIQILIKGETYETEF